jgi:hypothetical protein
MSIRKLSWIFHWISSSQRILQLSSLWLFNSTKYRIQWNWKRNNYLANKHTIHTTTQDIPRENPLWGKTQPQMRTIPCSSYQNSDRKEMEFPVELHMTLRPEWILQDLLDLLCYATISTPMLFSQLWENTITSKEWNPFFSQRPGI